MYVCMLKPPKQCSLKQKGETFFVIVIQHQTLAFVLPC